MTRSRGGAPGQRQLRVGEEIRRTLARILARGELRDPALAGVTVTIAEVRVSPDLKNATAFITPPGGSDSGALLKACKRAAPFLRGQLAREMKLRSVPELRFVADLSFDRALEIERLIASPAVRRDLDREARSIVTRRRKGQPVDGWLILDKPEGLGSTSAVSQVRRLFDAAKAGHAGTLDPLASGILPIALGEATKTVPFLHHADKIYRFTVRWGEATATDDSEGPVIATHAHRPDEAAIRAALPCFLGAIEQRPPAYCALKLNGRRAYALARGGHEVTLAARPVQIHALSLVQGGDADHGEFEVRCGKGVYVRSLARDLARNLGTLGHVSALRRCAVGPFTLSRAITLDKLQAPGHSPGALKCLFPVQTALDDIPALAIGQAEADALRQGQTIAIAADLLPKRKGERCDAVFLACFGHRAVALVVGDGEKIRPTRVFNLQT